MQSSPLDRETLVAELRRRGVDFLAPSDARAARPMNDGELLSGLAASPDPRLRQALIALFLLNPGLAPQVPPLCRRLEPQSASQLKIYYQAAVYLREMWSIRLRHYLDSVGDLPDHFSSELHLPKPEEEFGKVGLCALAEWQAQEGNQRGNPMAEYEGTVELLFASLKCRRDPA